MLSELAANRALLESEQAAAAALRAESEQAREEYRNKLARLQERRDKLFGEMRRELDASFRSAHSEVARIIAELQRSPSSRRAADARERLEALREETEQRQLEQDLMPEPSQQEPERRPVDWPSARVGDAVGMPGGGHATLLSLPDRKGRVSVRASGARVSVARDALSAPSAAIRAGGAQQSQAARRAMPAAALPPARIGGTTQIDLRGERVEEALDRLDAALDLAASEGRDELLVIHGIGTGALKKAVREHLPRSPHVVDCLEAAREQGGAGATRAILGRD